MLNADDGNGIENAMGMREAAGACEAPRASFGRMAVRRRALRRRAAGIAALAFVIGCFAACCVGCSGQQARFGLGKVTTDATKDIGQLALASLSESPDLTVASTRDISDTLASIEEEVEALRAAAAAKLLAEEQATLASVNEKIAKQRNTTGIPWQLSEVNWAAGKAAFLEEWTTRIDAYLAGSPLAGQGYNFAIAAWDNRVDPRWSPAISMTESTRGLFCFRNHNAWGYGQYSFESWEEGIATHVKYLSDTFYYTVSRQAAKIYCPPTWESWYGTTVGQMKLI